MRIVDHPVRMTIIELLATRGPMSWKELSVELGTGTGSLYHHLDTLEKIVARDSSRKYVLTPLGQEVYARFRSLPIRIPAHSSGRTTPQTQGSRGPLGSLLSPRTLLRFITSTPARSVTSLVLISALVLGVSSYAGIQLLLFAFGPAQSLLITLGSYLVSLFLVTGISYGAASLLFKQKPEILTLLSASSLSFLPMACLALLLNLLVKQNNLGILADRTALTALIAVFQGWSVLVLSSGTAVASGLRIEKTLIVGLILLYISMSVLFIQGRIT
jgi:hypothetical protein